MSGEVIQIICKTAHLQLTYLQMGSFFILHQDTFEINTLFFPYQLPLQLY
jgi:hypothetical protein